jgi:hypothetical protein
MFHRTPKHLTPSTAIAFFALVFALTGGAFAATSHGGGSPRATATASKVKPKAKPGPRGPAGPKGTTGATGAAGATGATGATGPAGAAGAKGENGAAGAAGATGPQGPQGELGKEGKEGPEGPEGPEAKGGGFPTTLPAGDTETGSFVAHFEHEGFVYDPISFPIPLPVGVSIFHYVKEAEQGKPTAPAECAGSVAKPTATKGTLCVYEGEPLRPEKTSLVVLNVLRPTTVVEEGTSTAGAVVQVAYEGEGATEPAYLSGTWAVSAP